MATARKMPSLKASERVVDSAGTDSSTVNVIRDAAQRQKALSGLEPTKPTFGNPIKQIGGFIKKTVGAVQSSMAASKKKRAESDDLDAKIQGEDAYRAEQKARALKLKNMKKNG